MKQVSMVMAVAGMTLLVPVAPIWAQAGVVAQAAVEDTYKVSPGDVLGITVLGHPEFSLNAQVLPDGTFAYPFLGVVQVQGLSRDQIRKLITDKLISSKQLVRPVVTVNVVERERREVVVSGTIRGGVVPLKNGDRILDALNAVGGLGTDRYEFFTAELLRDGKVIPLNLVKIHANDSEYNLELKNKDQLVVRAKTRNEISVTVIGPLAKGNGGTMELPKDRSIVTVLNDLGGISEYASLKNATILRGNKTIPVDLRGYRKSGKLEKDVPLEPGDILNIPRNEERFKINGQVGMSGEQLYPEDRTLTLFDALTLAKIPPVGAELKKVRLTRVEKGVTTSQTYDVDKMLKGDRSADVALLPGDDIFVPATDPNKRRMGFTEYMGILGSVASVIFLLRQLR